MFEGSQSPAMRDLAFMGEVQPDRPNDRADRDVWGDEPHEVDASSVVEEIDTAWPEVARRWHDHPFVAPFKAVGLFIKRSGKRIAVTAAGGFLVIVGIALLVLPGPGWLVIFLGLGILATEYVWAERLLQKAKEKANQAKDKVLRRKSGTDDGATA
jgi:Putative transmembrane protein (PGPGW)